MRPAVVVIVAIVALSIVALFSASAAPRPTTR